MLSGGLAGARVTRPRSPRWSSATGPRNLRRQIFAKNHVFSMISAPENIFSIIFIHNTLLRGGLAGAGVGGAQQDDARRDGAVLPAPAARAILAQLEAGEVCCRLAKYLKNSTCKTMSRSSMCTSSKAALIQVHIIKDTLHTSAHHSKHP